MEINKIIKSKREEKGYTMKELAERVGVSEGTVSRWESGEIDNMRRKNIVALSKVLDIKPAVIMDWEEPEVHRNEFKTLNKKFSLLTPTNKTTVIGMIDLLLSQQVDSQETAICV